LFELPSGGEGKGGVWVSSIDRRDEKLYLPEPQKGFQFPFTRQKKRQLPGNPKTTKKKLDVSSSRRRGIMDVWGEKHRIHRKGGRKRKSTHDQARQS